MILLFVAAWSPLSDAQSPSEGRVTVDRVVVRFYAPETGGSARPRFITERMLAFEARLEAMGEEAAGAGYQERHLRAALDQHIAEELLSSLAIEGGKESVDLPQIADDARAELEQRIGGAGVLRLAAEAEGIDSSEVDAMLRRHARAAVYIDRNVSPLLAPDDEQLREVFRTSAHPFRSKRYDDVKVALRRWFIAERLKAAEASFLQTARTRIKVVVAARQ